MNPKERIYLLFGGQSTEHEISVITASLVFRHIDREKYDVFPIYLDKENQIFYISNFMEFKVFPDFQKLKLNPVSISLGKKVVFTIGKFNELPKPDALVVLCHGGVGENGSLQGFLDILNIPYTGPLVQGAVYGMDKIGMKKIMQSEAIPMLPWMYIEKKAWEESKEKQCSLIKEFHPYPLIVKPAELGSSIGVQKVIDDEMLQEAIELAFMYDSRVVIEKFGENMIELICSVRKSDDLVVTSAIGEVNNMNTIFTYEDKYLKGGKKMGKEAGVEAYVKKLPAHISKGLEEKVKAMAVDVYTMLRGESLARIDFLVNEKTEEIFPIEINTIPGALSFFLWEAVGVQFHELLESMISEAIATYTARKEAIPKYKSPLLE